MINSNGKQHFLISYSQCGERWATWLVLMLEANGYFRGGLLPFQEAGIHA
jgi:hypothetical protein